MEYKKKYPRLYFLSFDDSVAAINGFWNSSYIIPKKTISWDKALFYFSKTNIDYDYVWYIEDDVYVPSKESLINLDLQYGEDVDLLCSSYALNDEGDVELDGWVHWNEHDNKVQKPWARGLQCICRMSKRLMNKIDEFVTEHKKLVFIELLFTSLARRHEMTVAMPLEFAEVDCCRGLDVNTIDPNKIHHPIKDSKDQEMVRKRLELPAIQDIDES